MDQPKVDRMLRVMKLLTANNRFTISEIAQRLETSDRTVYRYIDTFRDAGFVVKKDYDIYKLDKSSPHFKEINDLLHFSEEEAYILKTAIESIDETNVIKENLKKKLYTLYNYKILAESVVKGKTAQNVNELVKAIEQKKQVNLAHYCSANSKDIRDRIVEPFAFTTNYIQIWAYEPSTGQNKTFKVSRIGEVLDLKTPWQNEQKHEQGFIDIFRMNSLERYSIKLKLSLRAASLLKEEYPLAEKQLTKLTSNIWILETEVCSFEGVGRFVLGLMDEIEIISSNEFKEFIALKIKNRKV